MEQPLHILHIEDSREDSELVERLLSRGGIPCEMKRIENRAELFDSLQNEVYDLILSDCRLPRFSGLEALEISHALKPDVPFIFVSGTIGEEAAIDSLRNGATDYILKDRLARLVPAVRRALTDAQDRTLSLELRQRLRQARRMEAITTLANGIAHDFNNILTIILGHSSLLNAEANNPTRVREINHTISHAARRAAEIVEQLLAFARKSSSHLSPLDLNEFVQRQLATLRAETPASVQIQFEPDLNIPDIRADDHKLERILINLIANAVESMPEGGHITLTTKLVPASILPALLPTLSGGSYVCLQVADTGHGMDEMTRNHVFEPFYTTKERGHATGLGLPVAYGLMQSQNGTIHVDSEVGKGTTISLYFPESPPSSVHAPVIAVGADPTFCGTETILVVEDELDVCFFLETILESHGYRVLSAHNHDEALKLFEANKDQIALVFSDVGLPSVDGISMCTELRALKPDLAVVLSSGYSPKEFKDRLTALAPNAFVPKPYNTRDVLQSISMILKEHARK